MDALRHNIDLYVEDKGITLNDISERSGLSVSTISNVLYKDSKDVMLGTAIALAKAFGVTVDELVGSQTMDSKMRESVRICRGLPEHSLYLIRYFIRHQNRIYSNIANKDEYISVLIPRYENGVIQTTNVVEPMCISNLPIYARIRAYIGLKIPSENYMPYYQEGDIILIASDRNAEKGERCVVTSNGGIYIVEKSRKENEYISLVSRIKIPDTKIDDNIGYIVGFLNPDLTWGIR